jgi:hypothetical protein
MAAPRASGAGAQGTAGCTLHTGRGLLLVCDPDMMEYVLENAVLAILKSKNAPMQWSVAAHACFQSHDAFAHLRVDLPLHALCHMACPVGLLAIVGVVLMGRRAYLLVSRRGKYTQPHCSEDECC